MKEPDQSLREATALLDAGRDLDALAAVRRLAEQTQDPVLQRELEDVISSGRAASRGFRETWDRLLVAYTVGR